MENCFERAAEQLTRTRRPLERIHIGHDAIVPFVMGVIAPLRGNKARNDTLNGRDFLEITSGTFDEIMKFICPTASFKVDNILANDGTELMLVLKFEGIDDFMPSRIGRSIERIYALLQAHGDTASDALDKRLSAQMNLIVHHPAVQELEGTWRGLHHLVSRTLTGPRLKIRVMDLSKEELSDMMQEFGGTLFPHCPLFKKINSARLDPSSESFGCLIGDYFFDHSLGDVRTLEVISRIAAKSQCPFIAGASPSLFGMKSWLEINDPPRLDTLQDSDSYKGWHQLRGSPESLYVGLAMPRFVARHPYGIENLPFASVKFSFEEDTAKGDNSRYVWSNAAYAMGAGITRAFSLDGLCTRILGYRDGGSVDRLNVPSVFEDDGTTVLKCPTEALFSQGRLQELVACGLLPLVYGKNTDFAVFIAAPSLHRPQRDHCGDSGSTAQANFDWQLPHTFLVCRFAHSIKRIVSDRLGFTSRDELERLLQEWINNYVEPRLDASPKAVAQRSLEEARIMVIPDEDKPGVYKARLTVVPHISVLESTSALRLEFELPECGC